MNNQSKINEILQKPIHCWNEMILKPEVDESIDSIWLVIRYNDHGDDFLLIGTKDGKFHRYGYFVDRTCEFVRDSSYERKPSTYKKPDERAIASNTLFFAFRERFAETRSGFFGQDYLDRPRNEEGRGGEIHAQIKFDLFLEKVANMVAGDVIIHEHNNSFGYDKQSLRRYLELNKIATPENLKKLEDQPFDTRIDGFDGIAGKVLFDNDRLWFDAITYAYVNGHDVDVDTIPTYVAGTDEWGCDTLGLNLNSYRMSKSYA